MYRLYYKLKEKRADWVCVRLYERKRVRIRVGVCQGYMKRRERGRDSGCVGYVKRKREGQFVWFVCYVKGRKEGTVWVCVYAM